MRAVTNAAADVLFGRTRAGILGLLYGHSDEQFYVRQISREVGTSVGAVLSRIGLIARSSLGNLVFYQANQHSPLFPEISGLVAKTVGAFDVLRFALMPLSKRIKCAFVYGSVARNEETAESDIDLMVVGQVKLDDVLASISGAEKSLRRPVNPTVYSIREFKSKFASGNHFLNAVMRREKIFLIGAEDQLN